MALASEDTSIGETVGLLVSVSKSVGTGGFIARKRFSGFSAVSLFPLAAVQLSLTLALVHLALHQLHGESQLSPIVGCMGVRGPAAAHKSPVVSYPRCRCPSCAGHEQLPGRLHPATRVDGDLTTRFPSVCPTPVGVARQPEEPRGGERIQHTLPFWSTPCTS